MAKLTDTQLIVLSKAAKRGNGIAVIPSNINKAAASKVGSSLVARKLMREVRSKSGMPVWREADGHSISLMLTRAGRDAIGVDEGIVDEAPVASKATTVKRAASSKKPSPENRAPPQSVAVDAPRAGSKQALVIGMLSSRAGASLDTLVEATGWLPHTTRAALTGLRKRGFAIERSSEKGRDSVYRIVSTPAAAAA